MISLLLEREIIKLMYLTPRMGHFILKQQYTHVQFNKLYSVEMILKYMYWVLTND